ncbi:cytochrome c oxidase accessory protein CcoG [Halioxenophilus sp. WMMB6]|uniref:cytochrome c oxidase accessory protein CcoG n=1 Tax=Halioxenophilus sp. WMMB6 TaxID=3073815 RepID=UPI00295F2E5C|nr:cytochrome c oxidase accessory protein CcoG [Halioxenophilus sp. WMMB6]
MRSRRQTRFQAGRRTGIIAATSRTLQYPIKALIRLPLTTNDKQVTTVVDKIPVHEEPVKQADTHTNLYQSANKVYVRKIDGFYQSIRRYTGLPLLLGFVIMPWLTIDGRPAMLFDLPARKFHILWSTFWPQDGMLLAWLLIIAAFTLFTVTTLVGRVWCGFTCPQTVWTLMYIWAERVFEGDRNKRIKLDRQDWNAEKVARKSGKHATWLLIGFITGITFVGYFTPVRGLLLGFIPHVGEAGVVTWNIAPAAAFWTLFFTGMTYLNAGWMREQVCKYMCPYARFQSVMYDKETLAVHYDKTRGEARGPRKAGEDYKANGKGDCIDCSWCVQVCPVDIDIRDGLQYECINCGLCVDACNSVMDKMGYERGLVRFTSQDALETGHTRFFRPRLFGYSFAVIAMLCAFVYAISDREPLSVDVVRDRGTQMYRVRNDQIVNVYTVKINNMDRSDHTYDITVRGDGPYELSHRPVYLEEGEVFTVPVQVKIPRDQVTHERSEVYITVTAAEDESITAEQEASFIAPLPK